MVLKRAQDRGESGNSGGDADREHKRVTQDVLTVIETILIKKLGQAYHHSSLILYDCSMFLLTVLFWSH